MDTLSDRIFVINLKERIDRYERFTNEFTREGITNWERFDAIRYDPKIHGYESEFNNFLKDHDKSEHYLKSAFGCMLSHYTIIKIAKERGYNNVIILEDDFIFTQGWKDNLNKCLADLEKMPWLFFYFHMGYYSQNAYINVTENLVCPRQGLGTTGYVVKKEMFDFLLDNMLKYGKQIDVFYFQKIQNSGIVLAAKNNIIIQGESWSDIEQNLANIGGR